MTLTDRINNDIKEAMKAKHAAKLTALRAIKAQLLLAATAQGSSGGTSDEEGIKMLQKQVKQRKESAEVYVQQGRQDLADPELAEAAFIEEYLPKQLTEDELKPLIAAIISRMGAAGPQDLGKVMGAASKELAGKADGKTISGVVKALLG
ncbi:MAG: GatB/YqeY domain-containing protein [Flavobacteriales bacterium]|nr:GatB/YqeY domain-containing protein [Flavobacteriales bacterium]